MGYPLPPCRPSAKVKGGPLPAVPPCEPNLTVNGGGVPPTLMLLGAPKALYHYYYYDDYDYYYKHGYYDYATLLSYSNSALVY